MQPARLPRRLLAAAAAPAVLSTTACGSDSADAGNGLVVYSGRNENLIAPLLEKFTEATGIAVTPRYGGSAELAAQLLEEGSDSPASVFLSQDAGALGALEQADRLAPLEKTTLDKVPAKYRSDEGRWVGVSGRSRVLVYDSTAVTEAELPQSVFDLTAPEYRGKVGIAPMNASFQAFVTGMRVTEGEERTKQFLTDLAANDARIYENNIAILQAVNAGEIPFGLANHYYLYERAAEAGGLDELNARNHLFPGDDPGSLVNVAGVAVLAGKPDARTQALVDYLLSSEAQTYFAEETKEFPLVAGVSPDVPGLPPLSALQGPDVDLSELESLETSLKLLEEVGLL